MGDLAALVVKLLADNAAARARDAARRAMIWALAAMAGLLALGFGLAAGWLALARWQGEIAASLMIGAGFLVLALGLALLARRKPRHRGLTTTDLAALEAQASAIAAAAPEVLSKHPLLPLIGSFLGGLLLALKLTR